MIDKIKIGYKDYKVSFDDCLNIPDKDDTTYYGQIDYQKEAIKLNPILKDNKYQCMQTFIHEVLHRLFKDFGANKYSKDEDLINLIATGLVTIIRDNNIDISFDNYVDKTNPSETAEEFDVNYSDINYSKWIDKDVWCWDNDYSKKVKQKFKLYCEDEGDDFIFITYDKSGISFGWKHIELVENEDK